MGGFLPGLLGDLLRLMKTDAPLQWELALQLAQSVASDNATEDNPDPLDRIRLEELVRIAELHVADVTGMTTTASGRPLEITVANRGEWARQRLESSRQLFEEIAGALAPVRGAEVEAPEDPLEDDDETKQLQGLFTKWASAVAPAMIGMQFGSLVGHLAHRSLGQYELPLPRGAVDSIVIVPANLKQFSEDWSLPPDDVALYVAVRDVVSHAILSRPHVADRLAKLLVRHAQGFRPDPNALQRRLGEAGGDMSDLSELSQLLGDPSALGELVDSPEQRQVNAELGALSAAILGYVEWVSETIATRAVSARSSIEEALRRRRMEPGEEGRAADALLGFPLDQETVDRGLAFVRGVLERGGDSELAMLFVRPSSLPTPAEIAAPGLWIERVNLPDPEDGTPGAEAPE
jgi:putative hydrolase